MKITLFSIMLLTLASNCLPCGGCDADIETKSLHLAMNMTNGTQPTPEGMHEMLGAMNMMWMYFYWGHEVVFLFHR